MYLINNIFIAKFNTAATIVVFPIILVSLYAVNIPPIKDDKLEKYVAIINNVLPLWHDLHFYHKCDILLL